VPLQRVKSSRSTAALAGPPEPSEECSFALSGLPHRTLFRPQDFSPSRRLSPCLIVSTLSTFTPDLRPRSSLISTPLVGFPPFEAFPRNRSRNVSRRPLPSCCWYGACSITLPTRMAMAPLVANQSHRLASQRRDRPDLAPSFRVYYRGPSCLHRHRSTPRSELRVLCVDGTAWLPWALDLLRALSFSSPGPLLPAGLLP
jgi:hypothetical protein